MKMLICIPKVRQIEEFDNAVNDCLQEFDKVFINYYPSYVARHLIKEYFMKYEEYTHLAILPDDMVPNKTAIDILLNDLSINNYPFLCGRSHLNDTEEGRKIVTVSLQLSRPELKNGTHHYDFLEEDTPLFSKLLAEPQPIKIKHMGDPFPIIRRDVAAQLSFDNDHKYNNTLEDDGCCEDIVMCLEMDRLRMPIFCDLRAWFKHLKISDEDSKNNLLVDREIANIHFAKGK